MNVLVTGASSGIGAVLARTLAQRGHTVGLVGRDAGRTERVLADCHSLGALQSRAWVADLADLDRAAEVAVEAWQELGHLDVLVNNAGMPMRRHTTRLEAGEVEDTMCVNFHAPVRMTLVVLPLMLARRTGVVLNVAGLAGRLPAPGEAAYCASKFALCGWSESIAADLWGTGVAVRLVHPGPVDTDFWSRPGNDAPTYDGPKLPVTEVAAGVIAAMDGDVIERYLPDVRFIVDVKNADMDSFIAGVSRLSTEGLRLPPRHGRRRLAASS
jgi:short-subunit dehydrogenase